MAQIDARIGKNHVKIYCSKMTFICAGLRFICVAKQKSSIFLTSNLSYKTSVAFRFSVSTFLLDLLDEIDQSVSFGAFEAYLQRHVYYIHTLPASFTPASRTSSTIIFQFQSSFG